MFKAFGKYNNFSLDLGIGVGYKCLGVWHFEWVFLCLCVGVFIGVCFGVSQGEEVVEEQSSKLNDLDKEEEVSGVFTSLYSILSSGGFSLHILHWDNSNWFNNWYGS